MRIPLMAVFFWMVCWAQSPALASSNVVEIKSTTARTVTISEFKRFRLNPRWDDDTQPIGFPELAALAANVYMPENEYESGCDPAVNRRINVPDWHRLRGWSEPQACNSAQNGLHYEVWGKHTGDVMHIAIVFRGTIASRLAHWCANLRGVSHFFCDPASDQYLAIAGLMDEVMSGSYDEWGPDRYLFVVGHSLGGGLAELAGRSSYVHKVVTFNSSPVTADDLFGLVREAATPGESQSVARESLERTTRCGYVANNPVNADRIQIHRVYEDYDLLTAPRRLAAWAMPINRGSRTIEYKTDLLSGSPLAQHSMKALACAMRQAR